MVKNISNVLLICCCPEQAFSVDPIVALIRQIIRLLDKEIDEQTLNDIVLRIVQRKASVSAYPSLYL